mmetsp:Transcript_8366/g.18238  ORF Transcript_8366/g.18238 Transcript_8366/m.18238 type:complete len:81 (+) Transcript_8366:540-782(+)
MPCKGARDNDKGPPRLHAKWPFRMSLLSGPYFSDGMHLAAPAQLKTHKWMHFISATSDKPALGKAEREPVARRRREPHRL